MITFLHRLGSLPGVATVLTGITAAYMALVAFGNITDFDSNQAFVDHVLEMDTTFNDSDVMWRAIENNTLANTAYVGIIVAETIAALVLIWGFVLMMKAFGNGAWEHARKISSAGVLLVMVIFGLGFITIGGEWFSMWQSSDWNGLSAAIRNFTLAGFTMVMLHMPSRDWNGRDWANSDSGDRETAH